MTRKKAYMFPGQGSQSVGMGKELHDRYKEVRDLFVKGEDITNLPLRKILFANRKNLLEKTSNTQVGLVIVSLGILAVYLKQHRDGTGEDDEIFMVGHSVGEVTAAVAGRAITEDDAISAVLERGLAMEDAGRQNPGKMSAILGKPYSEVEDMASRSGVYVANYNVTDQQTVVSGDAEAIDKFNHSVAAASGKVIPLSISIPAHSPLMIGAVERFKGVVEAIPFLDPIKPIVSNKTARIVERASELKESLPNQLTLPVYWSQSIEHLRSLGVKEFVEIGPKEVLSGLVRRQTRGENVLVRHAETDILKDK